MDADDYVNALGLTIWIGGIVLIILSLAKIPWWAIFL